MSKYSHATSTTKLNSIKNFCVLKIDLFCFDSLIFVFMIRFLFKFFLVKHKMIVMLWIQDFDVGEYFEYFLLNNVFIALITLGNFYYMYSMHLKFLLLTIDTEAEKEAIKTYSRFRKRNDLSSSILFRNSTTLHMFLKLCCQTLFSDALLLLLYFN